MKFDCLPGDDLHLDIDLHLHLIITEAVTFTSQELCGVIADYLNKKMHRKEICDGR